MILTGLRHFILPGEVEDGTEEGVVADVCWSGGADEIFGGIASDGDGGDLAAILTVEEHLG